MSRIYICDIRVLIVAPHFDLKYATAVKVQMLAKKVVNGKKHVLCEHKEHFFTGFELAPVEGEGPFADFAPSFGMLSEPMSIDTPLEVLVAELGFEEEDFQLATA